MGKITKIKTKYFLFLFILFLGNHFVVEAKPSLKSLATNLPEVSSLFVGRQGNLKELHSKLEARSGAVAIVGMAGMGKTQLARKYASTYGNAYHVIWWMDGNQDLLPQIRELGLKLRSEKSCPMPSLNESSSEQWIGAINNCCEKYFSNVLILIDDVKNEELLKPVFQILTSAHILLTSRDQSVGEKRMHLKCFTRRESIEYLKKLLSENSENSLDELAKTLNDYPLALFQAATYISLFPSLSVEEYIRLYKEKRKTLWKEEEQYVGQKNEGKSSIDYRHTVSTTFTLLLDQVKIFPHAFELLKFSSLLGSQDIPKELLKRWMLNYSQINEFDFHKALSSLIKLSIFEKAENTEEKENYFNIHALLQEFIRDSLKREERRDFLKDLTNLISTYLPESSQQVWKVLSKDRYLEFHLESLLRFANQYDFYSDELLKLKIKQLHFAYFFKFDTQTVSGKIFELEKEVKNNNKIQPLDKARFLTLLSNYTAFGANCEQAIYYSEEAEELLTNVHLQEAREELFFLLSNNLMDFYSYRGDLKKAEEAAKKAEHLLPHISDLNIIALYHHIRVLQLLVKGDYADALKHIDLSIENSLATDYLPYVYFFKKAIKAEILAKLGEMEQALTLAEINYKELKKFYPDASNYKTIRTEITLAFIYLKKNKLKEASDFISLIIDGLNTFYKKPYESPLQVWPHILLGEFYEKHKDFSKALEEYNKAEDICRHIYSTIEVDDMSYLYKNLSILGEKVNDDFITKKYFQLLLTHYGRNHSRTQDVVDYLEEKGRQVPWSKL
jgi:tetratricopeptide (TPR) repeat protein